MFNHTQTIVPYKLNNKLRNEIVEYKDLILKDLKDKSVSVYLFGSIAKGGYSVNSDIDLLIIIKDADLTPRDKKELRIRIRDLGYDLEVAYNFSKELDCKVYGEVDFLRSSASNNFEKQIVNDLVDVTDWVFYHE